MSEGIEEVAFQRANGRFGQGKKGIRLGLRKFRAHFRNDKCGKGAGIYI